MKGIYLINLLVLSGSLLARQSGLFPLALSMSLVGTATSSVLVAKSPRKSDRLIEAGEKLIEVESAMRLLQEEVKWFQSLVDATDARLAEAVAQKDREWERNVSDLSASHQALLKAKDDEIRTERAKASSLTAQWQEKVESINRLNNSKIEALQQALIEVTNHRDSILDLEKELKRLEQALDLKERALKLEEKRIKLDVRDERGNVKLMLDEARLELQSLTVINQRLQKDIELVNARNRELYEELYERRREAEELPDQTLVAIQAALAQQGIDTVFEGRKSGSNVETYLLNPTAYYEPSKLAVVEELLPGFIDIPRPQISATRGRLEVRIDYRDELDRIKDAPENWLEILYRDAAKDGKNLAILGARGMGKTELAKNYCGLVVSNEPDAEILYIQPKVDDYAAFRVGDKEFTPDYVGFQPITSDSNVTIPSAYDGILYLRRLYKERNEANQKAFANGEPTPRFNRVFFLIDELQMLVTKEREYIDSETIKTEKLRNNTTFCGKVVRDAISLGRSLGITVLALGQIPNVSQYGWQKADLCQYIVIFMAANIYDAVSYAPGKEEKGRILGELDLWRKRAGIDASKSYYCYVRPMDKVGYLALLPPVGTYLTVE